MISVCSLVAVLVLAVPAPEASAGREDLIVFDDDSSCDVRMQNVHSSTSVFGDVSAAVDVACHPPGAPRAELVVEEITARTTFYFSRFQPIPGFIGGEEIGTCETLRFVRRPSATLPCHQAAFSESGWYEATSTVTATLRGQTEEVEVSRVGFLGGFA